MAKKTMADGLRIRFSAKCDDRFAAYLSDGREHDGYVPDFLSDGDEDYIRLEVDLKTGQILNWVPPTDEQLDELFEGNEDEEDDE